MFTGIIEAIGVVTNLKQAFAKDSNLKTKASKDREFLKFMNDTTFSSAVN